MKEVDQEADLQVVEGGAQLHQIEYLLERIYHAHEREVDSESELSLELWNVR